MAGRAPAGDAPLGAEYGRPEPFVAGDASHPWDGSFSPQGRWFAIVDGYGPRCRILDVATRAVVWTSVARELWTHRGAFSSDDRRFVTVASAHMLVLDHDGTAWKETARVPLGFETGLGNLPRGPIAVSLSADARHAVLVEKGRVWRVDLGARIVTELPSPKPDAFHAFFVGADAVAVGHVEAFETRVHAKTGATVSLPGVLVRPSPNGRLWLVASDRTRFDTAYRDPRPEPYRMALEVRKAGTTERVCEFVFEARSTDKESSGHRLLMSARFSADAERLVFALGTGLVELRDAATGCVVQTVETYAAPPYAMDADLSPDRSLLVTAGRTYDGPGILVWKRESP